MDYVPVMHVPVSHLSSDDVEATAKVTLVVLSNFNKSRTGNC